MKTVKVTDVKVWVYQCPNGAFYKHDDRGSWAKASKPSTRAQLQTRDISEAAMYSKKPDVDYPYVHASVVGGKWLEVMVTTSYDILSDETNLTHLSVTHP